MNRFSVSIALALFAWLVVFGGQPFGDIESASAACSSPAWQSRPDVNGNNHPYAETGVGNELCWRIKVKSGDVAIVGGFLINGGDKDPYRIYKGSKSSTVIVLDGFVEIVRRADTHDQWCFRLDQAFGYFQPGSRQANTVDKNWRESNCERQASSPPPVSQPAPPAPVPIQQPAPPPLPPPPPPNRANCDAIRGNDYWSAEERLWFLDNCKPKPQSQPQASGGTSAPAPPAQSGGKATVNGLARRESGKGRSISFAAGEAVNGTVTLNGVAAANPPCYIASAQTGGTVFEGVVNPWVDEPLNAACIFQSAQPQQPVFQYVPQQPPTQQQPPTGPAGCELGANGKCRHDGPFATGEAFVGHSTVNGVDYGGAVGCYFASSPGPGTNRGGIANPRQDEFAGKPNC